MDEAARELHRRVSRRSTAWWRTGTAQGRTRAAAVEDLVATLAGYEHALEVGDGPAPAAYRRPPPPVREDALVDQLAVVAHDLVIALAAAPDPTIAARAAAACRATADEVDQRGAG